MSPAIPTFGSTTRSSSSTTSISDIWNTGFSTTSFNYNRFFGLASGGFGVYDTGASGTSLPNYYSIARDYKSPTFLGLGAGGGFSANLRAGVNLNVQGGLGSAALNLSDSIQYNWSRLGDNITLTSRYNYFPSSLIVNGPQLRLGVQGRADIDARAYLNYTYPSSGWKSVDLARYTNTNPFYQANFSTTQNASIGLFGGAASINYQGINLSTTRANNIQFGNGVISRVKDPILNLQLDVDNIIGKFLGLPSGLALSRTFSAGRFSLSGNLDIADIKANLNSSIAQDLSARVDSITGVLRMENGSQIPYRVGDTLTFSASQYDTNRDGAVDVLTNFAKRGTLNNTTNLLLSGNVDTSFLSGNVRAKFNNPWPIPDISKSWGFGPVFDPAPWTVAETSINVYNRSWGLDLGAVNHQIQLA
jgi:hypothetical protein